MVHQELAPYADAQKKITLNISMNAVEHFEVNSDGINLSIKFQGRPVYTQIPFMAIVSIYDKANVTTGMLFNSGFLWTAVPPPLVTPPIVTPTRKKPTLTIIK
jgi:stringent starvation protein B